MKRRYNLRHRYSSADDLSAIFTDSDDDLPIVKKYTQDDDDDFIVNDSDSDSDYCPDSLDKLLGSANGYVPRILNYCIGDGDIKEVIEDIKTNYKLNAREVANLAKLLAKMKAEAPNLKGIVNSAVPDREKCILIMDFCKMLDEMNDLSIYLETTRRITNKIEEYAKYSANDEEQKLLMNYKPPMKSRIMALVTNNKNKAVLLKWYQQYEESNDSKLNERLEWALSLPYDVCLPPQISPDASCYDRAQYLSGAKAKLDAKLYGMTAAKDKILHILNDRMLSSTMRNSAIAFVGPAGVGKCLAPNTPVLMYNGMIKRAEEINIGDDLMGDDSTPRIVQSIARGTDIMYTVYYCACREFTADINQYYCAQCDFPIRSYTVNSEHIMVVARKNLMVEVPMKILCEDQRSARGIRIQVIFNKACSIEQIESTINNIVAGECSNVSDAIIYSPVMTRLTFLAKLITELGMAEHNNIIIKITEETVAQQIVYMARTLAFHADYICKQKSFSVMIKDAVEKRNGNQLIVARKSIEYGIKIVKKTLGDYCGFTINKNRRFLLGDCTVTHNTELARCLSDILQLPFEQISMGGIDDPSILKGSNYIWHGSEPGHIVKAMSRMKYKNGIIFFDEIDKIPQNQRAEGVVGAMLEVADPTQNSTFRDHYLDELQIDLSELLFIYSLNNETQMDKFLSDRIPKIYLSGYELKDKIVIIQKYLLPAALVRRGMLSTDITIEDSVARGIIMQHTSPGDKGVRDIKHTLDIIAEKINMLRSVTLPDGSTGELKLTYKIENFRLPLALTADIARDLLSTADKKGLPYPDMYR